jgi:uncharacterized protein (TIGR04222 family)
MAEGIPHSELDAFAAGYLRGGPGATVSTVAATLIARKMVAVARGRRLVATVETVPDELSGLERAVLRSLDGPVTLGNLRSSREVRELLSNLDQRLTGTGLVPPRSHRFAWQAVLAVLTGVCVLGVVAVFERLNAGEPIVGVAVGAALSVLATVLGVVVARSRLRRDPAGERAFNELKQRYGHLKPAAGAAVPSDDPERAAWTVALFGGEVVPAIGADPAGRPNMGASTNASAAGGSGAGGI